MKKEVNIVSNRLLVTLTILVVLVLFFQVFGINLTGNAVWSREREPVVTYDTILDMLSNSENINPYKKIGAAVGPFLADGKTPNQFCKENGYGNCILVSNEVNEVYFDSTDGSCSGKIDYNNIYTKLNSPADCNTLFDTNFYRNFDPRIKESAECLMGGYASRDHWSSYYLNFICTKK